MFEAFYLNTIFLFVQILISLFLIWLCDREDEDDDGDSGSGSEANDLMLATVICTLLN